MHDDTRHVIAQVNYYITKHFRYTDLICPCCDLVKLTPGVFRHMDQLEELRKRTGFDFIITSGYRCPPHNREVGGALKSWHLLFATDIAPVEADQEKLKAMEDAAREMPFGGIGLYAGHMHLDLRPERTIWRG